MNALLPILLMTASAATPTLAPGDALPQLTGEYLSGRAATLPEASKGKVALLLLGFSYASRYPVEAWASRVREEFGRNPKVTFYEVPMIGGMARMGKWFIDSGMRRGTPKEDYEHVITVYGGTSTWKERLGVQDEKDAYLVLLAPDGSVAWRYSGKFDPSAYRSLQAEILRLAAQESVAR